MYPLGVLLIARLPRRKDQVLVAEVVHLLLGPQVLAHLRPRLRRPPRLAALARANPPAAHLAG